MALPDDKQLIFQTTDSTHIDLGQLDYTTTTHCYLEIAMYLVKGSLTQTGGYYDIVTLMQVTFNSDKWDTLANKTIGGIMLYDSAIDLKNTATNNIIKWSTSYGSQIAGVENKWITDDPEGGSYTVPSFTGALLYAPLVKTRTNPIDNSTVSGWSSDWVSFPIIDADSTTVFLPTSSIGTERNYSINSFSLEGNWSRQLSYTDSLQNFGFKITTPSQSTLVAFPPAPNIQNPQNVFPYNNIIDATKSTNFSFNFSGSTLGQYVVKIRSMDTGEIIYTSSAKKPFSSSNLPAYNGDLVEVELGALSSLSSAGIINNKQLSWEMDMYEYSTSGDYSSSVPFTTTQYYFETLDNPVVSVDFTPNLTEESGILTLNSRDLEVAGVYTQAQNVPLKYYRIRLYVVNAVTKVGTLIKDTGKIFSEKIDFVYNSFLADKEYKIEIVVETQKNQIWENIYNFSVKYEFGQDLKINGYAQTDYEKQLIKLSWSEDKYAIPTSYGTPPIYEVSPAPYNVGNNKCAWLPLSDFELIYDTINNFRYHISEKDFGIYARLKINGDVASYYGNNPSIISFFVQNMGTMKFTVDLVEKKLLFTDRAELANDGVEIPLNLYSDELFGVQNNSSVDVNAKYMWYVDETHTWTVSENQTLFIEPDIGENYTFLEVYTYRNSSVDSYLHFGARFATDPTQNTPWVENQINVSTSFSSNENSYIHIYSCTKIDALLYTTGNSLQTKLSDLYKPELSWNDYSDAYILCNYTDTASSSRSGQTIGNILGYEIFRQRKGLDYEESLGLLSVEDLKNSTAVSGGDFTIYDYFTRSNTEYTYTIYPYAKDGEGKAYYEKPYPVLSLNASNSQGIDTSQSQEIETDWLGYSLIPLIRKGKKKYGVPSTIGEEYSIWHFMTDRQEDAITQNQDKTLFTSFSTTPKVSVGMLNYDTGSISCKLGNVSCSSGNGCGEYIEPYLLVEKWTSFIAQNNICLLKNPKGDLKIVSIDSNTTRQYNNEYSNYYTDSDGYVTAYPTNISFSYTEVEKLDEVEIDITLIPKVTY